MNPYVRNIFAVFSGVIIGILVNGGIIELSTKLGTLAEGIDPMNVENIRENINLLNPLDYIFPFVIAHALGTLAGAYTVARITSGNKMRYAVCMGAFFLLGGIANVMMMGGPIWFNVMDLSLAYLPMGWLGGRMVKR